MDKNIEQHKNAEIEKSRQYVPKGARVGDVVNTEDPKAEATKEAKKEEL